MPKPRSETHTHTQPKSMLLRVSAPVANTSNVIEVCLTLLSPACVPTSNLQTTECSHTAVHGLTNVVRRWLRLQSLGVAECRLTLWSVRGEGSRRRTPHQASGSQRTRGRLGHGKCLSASAPCHRLAVAAELAEHPVMATKNYIVRWLVLAVVMQLDLLFSQPAAPVCLPCRASLCCFGELCRGRCESRPF